MTDIRLPCVTCGKVIPENEWHCFGGFECSDCRADRYARYTMPGCFAVSGMIRPPVKRRGRPVHDQDDMDSQDWDHRIDRRESEIKTVPVVKPASRKDQLRRKGACAANH